VSRCRSEPLRVGCTTFNPRLLRVAMTIIDFRDVIYGGIENLLDVKSWNSARCHEARCRSTACAAPRNVSRSACGRSSGDFHRDAKAADDQFPS